MDSKIIQAYNGLVLFFSERTNLFTIFLILLLLSSVCGNVQNARNTIKIAELKKDMAVINDVALKDDIQHITTELKKDNWGLYKRTITAIGDVNDSTINPDTGMVVYKKN